MSSLYKNKRVIFDSLEVVWRPCKGKKINRAREVQVPLLRILSLLGFFMFLINKAQSIKSLSNIEIDRFVFDIRKNQPSAKGPSFVLKKNK